MTKKEFLNKLDALGFTPHAHNTGEGFNIPESEETTEIYKLYTDVCNTRNAHKDHSFSVKEKSSNYNDLVALSQKLYNKYRDSVEQDKRKFTEENEIGEYEVVKEWGGEGEGDRYGFILHFKKHNWYLQAYGWYASYDGSDMSNSKWYFVEPYEKTIIDYRAININK